MGKNPCDLNPCDLKPCVFFGMHYTVATQEST